MKSPREFGRRSGTLAVLGMLGALLLASHASSAVTPVRDPQINSKGKKAGSRRANASLYERIGGRAAVQQLVSNFISKVSSDSRLTSHPQYPEIRKSLKQPRLKQQLADRLCHAAGGPCKDAQIEGLPSDVKLGAKDWLYVIQNASETLDRARIPKSEKQELLTLLLSKRGASAP